MYKRQHIHFIGIGGIGMSGIARILLNLGFLVSGSDLKDSEITRNLRQFGGVIYKGHEPQHVLGADVVVVSSAIKEENPELIAARAALIPVIPRAEMLASLMRLKKFGIAVAGSHGKTTTTSMVSSILREAGTDPTVIIGGVVKSFKSNAVWGEGDFLVAEADESDGSFLRLSPAIAVVTNIDMEHMDYFPDIDAIYDSFLEFLNRVPFYGMSVLCGDDPLLVKIRKELMGPSIFYGLSPENDIIATNIKLDGFSSSYVVSHNDLELGEIKLKVPGIHNVRNSLAAIGVALELEIPFDKIKKGIEIFDGVGRRFEVIGNEKGIIVIDDYGHHPTEIRATLDTAKRTFPNSRIIVLFEPHRYSRTHALMDEFTGCFNDADLLWISDIYAASEKPILGITGERLVRGIREKGHENVFYIKSINDMPEAVCAWLADGDVVITLGAGAINTIGPKLLQLLSVNKNAYVS